MKIQVKNWTTAEPVEEIDLSPEIFGLPERPDILARIVNWQLAKRRAGTHQTKGFSDVAGSGKKIWAQKGTGRARHGSRRAPQFRGGGVVFGPVVRSHAYDLPKKVRSLGLRTALSCRLADQALSVVTDLALESMKTSVVKERLKPFGERSILMIDGPEVSVNLKKAIANLPHVNVLPQQGINVYDILKHRHIILSKASIDYLKERFL